jgi:AAA domain-containing protein
VLYVDFELDADEQCRRAYQVARGVSLDKPPHDLLYVSGLGRDTEKVLADCLQVCMTEGVGLVVVDSLGIALQGEAESASDVIRFHHERLDPFRMAGVTLSVVDHQGKTRVGERYQNKRTFGSVYKENLARSVLQVEPGDRGRDLLTVKNALTDLRKRGLVEYTGEIEPKSKAKQVRLTEDGCAVMDYTNQERHGGTLSPVQ